MKAQSNSLLSQLTQEDLSKFSILLSGLLGIKQITQIRLKDFTDEYLGFIKGNCSSAYHRSVKTSFDYLLKYFSPSIIISEISLNELEKFINYLRSEVTGGYRVYFRNLRASFSKALEWNFLRENYFDKIKLPKQQKNNPQFLTIEEHKRILGFIKSKRIKNIISFGFYTGCRLSEILNLTWNDVDLHNKTITIGNKDFSTKTRKQRTVPICEEAFRILQTNTKVVLIVGFVFTRADGKQYNSNYISKTFKKASRRAQIDEGIHFHSLRHSFASNLVKNGVSLYKVKELLGHSSISTTEIYSHLTVDSLRDAVNVLN